MHANMLWLKLKKICSLSFYLGTHGMQYVLENFLKPQVEHLQPH